MPVVAALHWIIPHTHLVEEPGIFNSALLRTAYLVAFGLILHDVPEGFAMAVPIVKLRRRHFLYTAAFLSGLAEPLGAAIGLVAVQVNPGLNPLFMAFAAGAMIFVSAHELLPMAQRYGNTALFVTGGIASVFVYVVLDALV